MGSDFGIDQPVADVRDEVDDEHDGRDHDHGALQHGEVAAHHAVDQQRAERGNREDALHGDAGAQDFQGNLRADPGLRGRGHDGGAGGPEQ